MLVDLWENNLLKNAFRVNSCDWNVVNERWMRLRNRWMGEQQLADNAMTINDIDLHKIKYE